MKIIFITRKYPPAVGGMENYHQQLYQSLSKKTETRLIAWGGSQRWLPIIYFWLLLRSIFVVRYFKPSVVLVGDVVLAPLGLLINNFARARLACLVHGLDVTYSFPGYQRLFVRSLMKFNHLFCISRAVQEELVSRGIPRRRSKFIPIGINCLPLKRSSKTLLKIIKTNQSLKNKNVLLTVGRLIERKGHQWFIEQVMPKLGPEYVYLVAGDGPQKESIIRTIDRKNLEKNVFLLGRVSESTKNELYSLADLFIMPNIPVENDMEGFGIVILEAGCQGLYSLASNLEGIKDAVKNGANGILLKPLNSSEWVESVNAIFARKMKHPDRMRVRQYCQKNYSWDHIAGQYIDFFKS